MTSVFNATARCSRDACRRSDEQHDRHTRRMYENKSKGSLEAPWRWKRRKDVWRNFLAKPSRGDEKNEIEPRGIADGRASSVKNDDEFEQWQRRHQPQVQAVPLERRERAAMEETPGPIGWATTGKLMLNILKMRNVWTRNGWGRKQTSGSQSKKTERSWWGRPCSTGRLWTRRRREKSQKDWWKSRSWLRPRWIKRRTNGERERRHSLRNIIWVRSKWKKVDRKNWNTMSRHWRTRIRLVGKGNLETNHDEMGGRSEDRWGTRIREVSTRGSWHQAETRWSEDDLFAAMPPFEAKNALFAHVAGVGEKRRQQGQEEVKVMFVDLKKVHLTSASTKKELKRMRSKMSECYGVKVRRILGTGRRDVREIQILGGNLRWTDQGLEQGASDEHREAQMEGIGLTWNRRWSTDGQQCSSQAGSDWTGRGRGNGRRNGGNEVGKFSRNAELHNHSVAWRRLWITWAWTVGRAIRCEGHLQEDGESDTRKRLKNSWISFETSGESDVGDDSLGTRRGDARRCPCGLSLGGTSRTGNQRAEAWRSWWSTARCSHSGRGRKLRVRYGQRKPNIMRWFQRRRKVSGCIQ